MSISEIENALQVSHRDFYVEIKKNTSREYQKSDVNKLTKIYLSLYKYLSRITFRSTPYGLFSGVSMAEITSANKSLPLDKSTMFINVQPQLHEYIQFISKLNINFLTEHNIKLFLNPTLYSLQDKFYYVEKNLEQSHNASLMTVSKNKILSRVIKMCRKSMLTVDEISIGILSFLKGYSREEISSYINQLIKSQILLPDLYINPSEEDLSLNIQRKLHAYKDFPQIKEYFRFITSICEANLTGSIESIKEIKAVYQDKSIAVDVRLSKNKVSIPSEFVEKISEQCYSLFKKMPNRNAPFLERFIAQYVSKYENAQIPLLEALDPNFGIGYAEFSIGNAEFQPLTKGIAFNEGTIYNSQNLIDSVVEKSFQRFKEQSSSVIDIEDELNLLPDLSSGQIPVNESSYIFGNISADQDFQNFTFFPDQIYANQATKLFKRFSTLGDDIIESINQIYQLEQEVNHNSILAEVITIPNNHFSNIVLTKSFRKSEIPHFTLQNKNTKNIQLSDLVICIQEGKLRLYSNSLKKEIIPVVSHPYNTYLEDPICKFLSDVANQYTGGGRFWSWGKYVQEKHLPRITFKNIIVSRESWCIKKKPNNYSNPIETEKLIESLIKARKLPVKIILSNIINSDNEVMLDLSTPIARQILAKEINFNTVYLFEDIYSESRLISDGAGYYNTEIVIPYLNRREKYDFPLTRIDNLQKRTFLPGEEWLYVKIYAGSKLAETILSTIVLPFTKQLVKSKKIDKWFFIKYNDPQYHLRVRFHKSPDCSSIEWNAILYNLTAVINKKLGSNLHYKIVVDTYHRELERYGQLPLDLSELLFYYDSTCVANFLKDIYGDEGEIYRYKFSLLNVDNLLDSFGYSIHQKKEILASISQEFFNEHKEYFDKEKTLRQFLNNRYRELRSEIQEVFTTGSECHQELSPYLIKRNRFIAKNRNLFTIAIDQLIYSYIHMTLNRLFLINPRHHELLVYHLLNKYYESEIAKQRIEFAG
ncbi:thiopeptide-type bacteriocin biosynthesis protein [Chryseobacterium sp. RLHN22]|uniref:lantibiotic dehydratase n=1 Tax=Chryseobacterium sp. RLHN22 TaxID=3437885 RepID=UPI003D9ABC21